MEIWLRNLIISFFGTIAVAIFIIVSGGSISDEIGMIIFFGYWIVLNQWELMKNETKEKRKNKKKTRE